MDCVDIDNSNITFIYIVIMFLVVRLFMIFLSECKNIFILFFFISLIYGYSDFLDKKDLNFLYENIKWC